MRILPSPVCSIFFIAPNKKPILMAAPGTGRTAEKIARSYFFYSFAVQSYKKHHAGVPRPWSKLISRRPGNKSAWIAGK